MTEFNHPNRQELILLAAIAGFLLTGKWLLLVLCLAGLFWINPKLSTHGYVMPANTRTIAAYSAGRDNNFNLIRILAAWAVLFSHNYPLTGVHPSSWLAKNIGIHSGAYAVYIFFAISGFLVAKSFARKADLRSFGLARILRIIPALMVVCTLSALVLGGLMTSLDTSQYFAHQQVWKYIINNSLMIHTEYKLPGMFVDNPYPEAVNGSLWSLRYEMRMYIAMAILGVLGVLLERKRFLVFFLAFIGWYLSIQFMPQWPEEPQKTRLLAVVALYFYVGVCCFRFQHRIELSLRVSLLVLAGALAGWFTPLRELTLAIALCYHLFYFALVPGGCIRAYNRVGDYSYGFYLYAFPIQQVLVSCFPAISFASTLLWASVFTMAFAMLSWHLVEKPALSYAGPGRLSSVD